jgi:hypothetical protein
MVDVVDPFPWPIADLPFFAEHGTWQESPTPNVVDFQVEVGVPKRRRRTYIPTTQLQFARTITGTQLAVFLDFFEGTLRSGVYNFTAIDPRTGVSTEYAFLQVPSWRDMATNDDDTLWKLQFTLRRVNITPSTSSPP